MPRITSWSGWEAGGKWWSHTNTRSHPPFLQDRERRQRRRGSWVWAHFTELALWTLKEQKAERNYLHRTKHWYHQNNVTHGRDVNQTRRQPYANTTAGRSHSQSEVASQPPPAPTIRPPQQSPGVEILEIHTSCQVILPGLSFRTCSNTSNWTCFHS